MIFLAQLFWFFGSTILIFWLKYFDIFGQVRIVCVAERCPVRPQSPGNLCGTTSSRPSSLHKNAQCVCFFCDSDAPMLFRISNLCIHVLAIGKLDAWFCEEAVSLPCICAYLQRFRHGHSSVDNWFYLSAGLGISCVWMELWKSLQRFPSKQNERKKTI